RHERTAGSTSHFGSSKAASGSSAILFGGLSSVAMATPPPDTANRTALHAASQHDQAGTASDNIGYAAPAVDQSGASFARLLPGAGLPRLGPGQSDLRRIHLSAVQDAVRAFHWQVYHCPDHTTARHEETQDRGSGEDN